MHKAYPIYLALSIAGEMAYRMVFTVNMLYFVTVAQLNPLELVLVGTVLEASVFLFEIPTGIVADVYSRRLSIIIGMFLISAGFILEGALPYFLPILLAQVLWGVGFTFTSGATQAWISDEIGESRGSAAIMRGTQLAQFGGLVGLVLGVALGNIRIALPIITGGVLFSVMGLALIAFMPENGFHPTLPEERSTWQHLGDTFRRGANMLRIRPALIGILAIGLVFGIYSEGYDRLNPAFLLERFTFPTWGGITIVTWFGVIGAAGMLLTALVTGTLARRVNFASPRHVAQIMTGLSAVLVACLFLLPLSKTLWVAMALIWAISALREGIAPLYTAWVNHRLDSSVRATVLSMSSQVDALGQIGGGPLVGAVALRAGIPAGLLTSAGLLAPVLLLFAWQLRESGDNRE